MIRVERQDEPPEFDDRVRRPGLQALAEGKLPDHWRRCLHDLMKAYDGVCAYLCVKIPFGTVDHFVPKSVRPDLAYEWSNFRFADAWMNSRKSHFGDVVDPFEIEADWFHLVFPSCSVRPRPDLDASLRERVLATIRRLDLNGFRCRQAREVYYRMHRDGLPFVHLEQLCPFVALELRRQGLVPKED